MKELPKYSIWTYDPYALEENRRTDFTRRIPTGLRDKQMARDSKIAMQLVRIQQEGVSRSEEKMIDLFVRKAKWLSNPRYWELLRTVWVAAGSTETAPLFRMMMKVPPHRRNHSRGDMQKPIKNRCYGNFVETPTIISDEKFPSSIVTFAKQHINGKSYHPTEKPLDLIRYLVLTYTNSGG